MNALLSFAFEEEAAKLIGFTSDTSYLPPNSSWDRTIIPWFGKNKPSGLVSVSNTESPLAIEPLTTLNTVCVLATLGSVVALLSSISFTIPLSAAVVPKLPERRSSQLPDPSFLSYETYSVL